MKWFCSPRHLGLTLGMLCLAACKGSDSLEDFNPYGGEPCDDCTDAPGDGDGDTPGDGDGDDPGDGDGDGDDPGDGDGDDPGDGDGDDPGDGDGDGDHDYGTVSFGEFELTPDYDEPCVASGGNIDVNLGHTPESAVRALHCQVFGSEPDDATTSTWADALRTREYVRRIDVARTFCNMAGKPCNLTFSDPWKSQVALEDGCEKKSSRELGAVMMFFSECPNGINCDMYWANTHALGMSTPHAIYAFAPTSAGYYHPANTGFWRRELLDARWAGLSFLLLNTYGPDMDANGKPLARAVEALDDIGGGIGLAMMDDTWSWGRGDIAPWNSVPSFYDTEGSASVIYQNKWKRFFQTIPEKYWYKHEGRPLIYFYNAGTLEPRDRAAPVIARMKQMFADDFGVEPFVAVDSAFFEDEAAMNGVADGRFTWDTYRFGESTSSLKGVTLKHSMVRWDSVGRDRPGEIANDQDRMHKGPQGLEGFLAASEDADIAVVATWNDLGEGTGIHRNYDYFYQDSWLPPHHFLSLLRAAQCADSDSRSLSSFPWSR